MAAAVRDIQNTAEALIDGLMNSPLGPCSRKARLEQSPDPTWPPRQHGVVPGGVQEAARRRPSQSPGAVRGGPNRRFRALPLAAEEHGRDRRDRAALQDLQARRLRREQADQGDRELRAGRDGERGGDQGQGRD